jgi:hypothetical protein
MERLRREYASYDPKQQYALPSPTGSLTASAPANPLDRLAQQVTDSDYFRKLSPEAQKVITGTGQIAEMAPPVAAARGGYDLGAGAASGDYGQAVEGALNAVPELGPLAKTAMFLPVGAAGTNWGAYDTAKKMFKKGELTKDAEALHKDVWQKTGIGVLPEGKAFYEVNDQGLMVDPARGMAHPELWAHEPATKNIQFGVYKGPEGSGGYYDPNRNFIALNTKAGPELGGPRSIVGHELQHPIQQWYGLSPGASPNDVLNPDAQAYERWNRADALKRGADPAFVAAVRPGEFAYHGAAGEDLARNVQNRLNLDVQQRRDQHPAITSDLIQQGLPRLIYGGDRMLKQNAMGDQLAKLWDIYGYGGGP